MDFGIPNIKLIIEINLFNLINDLIMKKKLENVNKLHLSTF